MTAYLRPLIWAGFLLTGSVALATAPASPESVLVRSESATAGTRLDGRVEALRQTALAAQVAGAVVDIRVRAGERVKAGQTLIRLDAQAAQQGVVASSAQVAAAQAQLEVATQELDRQKALRQRNFISQSALERAQAQWEAAQAQVHALAANTRAAQAQTGFFLINAPYAGVVSEVPVKLGDMAMPGRVLATVYDPHALRIVSALPETLIAGLAGKESDIRIESPRGPGAAPLRAVKVEWLPAIDPTTHSAELRLDLPPGLPGLTPGAFARLWVPTAAAASGEERLFVPNSAIVHRAELVAVYVLDRERGPQLRQVRLGRRSGEDVEVLSGLRAGEAVLRTPLRSTP